MKLPTLTQVAAFILIFGPVILILLSMLGIIDSEELP